MSKAHTALLRQAVTSSVTALPDVRVAQTGGAMQRRPSGRYPRARLPVRLRPARRRSPSTMDAIEIDSARRYMLCPDWRWCSPCSLSTSWAMGVRTRLHPRRRT
jgi:hypothetical protein